MLAFPAGTPFHVPRCVGSIPTELGDMGEELQRLQLHNNKLTGERMHAHAYVGSPRPFTN